MALLLALLALLIASAVGLGLMYMSSTESLITSNYRDSQLAFFAMRAGLEEGRDRIRTNSTSPVTIPTLYPGGGAGSIVYITNPSSAADPVLPAVATNAYFDDELCHEYFSTLSITQAPVTIPCGSTQAPCDERYHVYQHGSQHQYSGSSEIQMGPHYP